MEKIVRIPVNGYDVYGKLKEAENSKTIAVLVNGFTGVLDGYKNIYLNFSNRLKENSYSVFRYNPRGTLPSEMKSTEMTLGTEIEDLKRVMDYILSLDYDNIIIVGESMGGLVLLGALNYIYDKCQEKITSIIFWYSEFETLDDYYFLYNDAAKKELDDKGYVMCGEMKIGQGFIDTIRGVNYYDKISKISCPVLFLHGDSDTEVDFNQSIKAHDLAKKPKEIHILNGADHCFAHEQDIAFKLTLDFLNRYNNN